MKQAPTQGHLMNVNFHSTPIITSNFTEACTLKISDYVYQSTYDESTQIRDLFLYTITEIRFQFTFPKYILKAKKMSIILFHFSIQVHSMLACLKQQKLQNYEKYCWLGNMSISQLPEQQNSAKATSKSQQLQQTACFLQE